MEMACSGQGRCRKKYILSLYPDASAYFGAIGLNVRSALYFQGNFAVKNKELSTARWNLLNIF